MREVLGAQECVFQSCGREDLNVRMLGNGRPFLLRADGARAPASAANLRRVAEILSSVGRGKDDLEVSHLQQVRYTTIPTVPCTAL